MNSCTTHTRWWRCSERLQQKEMSAIRQTVLSPECPSHLSQHGAEFTFMCPCQSQTAVKLDLWHLRCTSLQFLCYSSTYSFCLDTSYKVRWPLYTLLKKDAILYISLFPQHTQRFGSSIFIQWIFTLCQNMSEKKKYIYFQKEQKHLQLSQVWQCSLRKKAKSACGERNLSSVQVFPKLKKHFVGAISEMSTFQNESAQLCTKIS